MICRFVQGTLMVVSLLVAKLVYERSAKWYS